MSETNSLNPADQATDDSRRPNADTIPAPDAAGHALFERIGVGGMGEVYRYGDDALRRDLAIKVLKAELRGNIDAEERFLREAHLTGALQHPGIVPVHNLGKLADGEVQVMDWGLAKELSRAEPAATGGPADDEETVARAEEAEGLSRAGAALGTPSYMPPEQAAGDWDIVDERADVFALGAVLCQVLTGRPPYHGADRDDLLRRARRGDLAGALGRCGADAALVQLCRECLAPEREGRPRHAGVLAERLASYQAEVRERLRQAELERARAEVQALEERKRRRLRAALALAALLLLSGGALVWWRQDKADRAVADRQAEADRTAAQVIGEARLLGGQARAEPLSALGYDKAVLAAAKAGEVARAGGASEAVQRQAEELLGELQAEADKAAKDRRLLAGLLEVRGPREGPAKTSRDDKGGLMILARPTADEQFASAFRDVSKPKRARAKEHSP
jgi:hypothetical protein